MSERLLAEAFVDQSFTLLRGTARTSNRRLAELSQRRDHSPTPAELAGPYS